jgi:hypothetical protein
MGFYGQVDDDGGSYPVEFDLLVGMKLLFQVEKSLTSDIQFDGSFRVKRVCNHEIIIAKFDVGRFDNSGGRYCYLCFIFILNVLFIFTNNY